MKYRLGERHREGLIVGLFRRSTTAGNDHTSLTTTATGQEVAVELPDVLDLPLAHLVDDLQIQFAETHRPRVGVARLAHPFDVVHPDRPLLHQDRANVWTKEQILANLPSQIGSPHAEAHQHLDQGTTLTHPRAGRTKAT